MKPKPIKSKSGKGGSTCSDFLYPPFSKSLKITFKGGQHAPICNEPESFLSYQGGQYPPECHENYRFYPIDLLPVSGGQHGPEYPDGNFHYLNGSHGSAGGGKTDEGIGYKGIWF